MRVVNVISDTNVGGAGKCLVNYANNLLDDNIDLYVVIPKGSLLIPYFNKNVNVVEIDGLYDKSMDIKSMFKLIKVFRKIKPDIVHTHASIIARIVAKLFFNCKIIYTKHCYYDLKKYEHNLLVKWFYLMFDKIFSDRIIIVTEALRENMKDRGSINKKMVTIVNGVSKCNKLSVSEEKNVREKYGIKENDFVVSIIARLVKDKDHETFIKTAYEFKKKGILDIKFLIIGTGELLEQLKLMVIDLGLEDMVIFTGFVKNVSEILSITSLQVNCSIGTEATCMALLEGYSLGIPAVVSNFGGNSYIVFDNVNGYIVKTRDYKSFYKKIRKIKEDKNVYKKLSENALKMYYERYTIDRYVNEINKCYYSVSKR